MDSLPHVDRVERKPELSQFYTPPETAALIAAWTFEREPLHSTHTVLEPSAGRGALVKALREYTPNITAIDIDADNVRSLLSIHVAALEANFLLHQRSDMARKYTVAVMNPPFENGQAEAHVLHALTWANRVVAHVPLTTLEGVKRRKDLWSHVRLTRLAICSSRPKYSERGGQTAMCTIEVIQSVRRDAGVPQSVGVEFWP